MSRFLTITLCLLFSCSVSATESLFTILEPDHGPALLKQCSRRAPHAAEFWRPELFQVQELEAGLPALLDSSDTDVFISNVTSQPHEIGIKTKAYRWPRDTVSEKVGDKLRLPLAEYKRQYIGFIRSGEKFIYGNFYVNRPLPSSLAHLREKIDQTPVIICDGGSSSWGVVYSVEGKTFQDMAINGM
ncbi:MAG: hypothetical protein LBE81_12920 [Azonexus sp.]|jgi:hypothetical protein|uniref:hypothetical protein n=1 Tax=Azonexus sp. TaxID=1872668 RepID=UPI00282EEACE|nr:hypothetical protein [Azonexus sp.]MDR0777517.1 hypothetical protein [Azonexus sp.]